MSRKRTFDELDEDRDDIKQLFGSMLANADHGCELAGFIAGSALMVQDDGFSFSFYLEIKVEENSDWLARVQVVLDQICSYRFRSHNISIRSGDRIKLWLQNSVLVRSPKLPLNAIVTLGFSDKLKIHVTSPRRQLDLVVNLWSDAPTCAFNVDDSAWFDEPQPSALPVQPVLKATSAFRYTCLSNVTKFGALYNLVAVSISQTSIQKSSGGDWTCTLQLIDSSVSDPVKVNCFAKHDYYLPIVQVGSVVILKNAKGSRFLNTFNLVGYYDRLQWAIYKEGSLVHRKLPPGRESFFPIGSGQTFTPFFHTNDRTILDHCAKQGVWWDGSDRNISSSTSRFVPFLLIKDATPSVTANGYFHCLVEVIYKYYPEQGCVGVFVTDYTSNEGCINYELTKWCPPGLSSRILLVEFWDAARNLGRQLELGGFYSLKGVRIKIASNGAYEGKLQEPTAIKLDPSSEIGKAHQALQALIRRKSEWLDTSPGDGFDCLYTNVKEISTSKRASFRFSVAARVVHISPSRLEHFMRPFCQDCRTYLASSTDFCGTCGTNPVIKYALHFTIGIRDEMGFETSVLVWDDTRGFEYVSRVDLRSNELALNSLRAVIQRLCGNVIEHQTRDEVLNSPMVRFEGVWDKNYGKISRLVLFALM